MRRLWQWVFGPRVDRVSEAWLIAQWRESLRNRYQGVSWRWPVQKEER